jgi:RHS repeat-associated protein
MGARRDRSNEAMFRRYNRWHSRFDQPDPYNGSYDLTDPQSFNRYAYVGNDPVNFVDPSALRPNFFCEVSGNAEAGFSTYCVVNGWDRWGGFEPKQGGGGSHGGGGQKKPKPTPEPTPPDNKETLRRIAEGKAWDKWQQWVNCNTPIMNRYNAQLNNVRRFFGPASSRDIGAGLVRLRLFSPSPTPSV